MTGVKSPYVLGRETAEMQAGPAVKEMSDLGIEMWR